MMAGKPKRKVLAREPSAAASRLEDGWVVRNAAGAILGRATTAVNAWRAAWRGISV